MARKVRKYQKPNLKRVNPVDTAVTGPAAIPQINHGKPFEFKFSKEIQPDIIYDPSKLPESVSVDHSRCPSCGRQSTEKVLLAVNGGNSRSKYHCVFCGRIWGPEE